MTKSEAAQFLGVSPRAVERYVAAGKLVGRYVRGKTGQILDLEEAEVERFKAELEAPLSTATSGALQGATADDEARQAPTKEAGQGRTRQGATGNSATALARLDAASLTQSPGFLLLVQALREAATGGDKARLSVPVEAKPLLTLAECCALTGLSRALLKSAIDRQELKARQLGRAWRVRREELEEWLKTL